MKFKSDINRICEKCESDLIIFQYVVHMKRYIWRKNEKIGEFLEFECQECNYTWQELCLDAQRKMEKKIKYDNREA